MLANMLANSIEEKTIRALGRMSKDFENNKIKYQTMPTTLRRMLGKSRCVKKNKGMPKNMLRDVEFFLKNNHLIFCKQK